MHLQLDSTYAYTANDQRLTENVLQENPDTQAIDQRNWTFGYDTQDQLTSVTDDGTTLYTYNYDGVGNRIDAGSVNSMNQYASFHYNGRGDVTDDGTYSYTWDAKDRLTSATPDSPDAQSQKDVFTYDPENRRTQEDIYTWDTDTQAWVYASSLKFVYDGSQMVAELDGQNHLLQSYAWGPDGRLMSITDCTGGTPTNYQVVTDGGGSVVELLNSSTGLVVASYQYDPWGNPLSATGPAAGVSPFRWQGEFYDANFGGYYMGAREGSARLHIFLSPDPSGEGSDDNLYREVGNDPINKGDSTGLRYDTLVSLWNKATTIASAMNNPTQFMVDHPQIALGVGNTIQNMAVDSARNPQAFQAGQVIGGVNAAAQMVTGSAAMVANAKDTGVRILGEAANASDEEINAAIAADQANELMKVPDQLRQQGAGQAIQFMGSAYGDPQAVQSGATFGAIEFNAGMLLTAAIDLPATIDSIGEGILQFASWASKLSEGAEAEAETASILSGVQSFTSAPLTLGESAAERAIQIPQTAPRTVSLDILNPQFTPDPAGILQAHVDAAGAELAANPAVARTVLSNKELAQFLNPNADFYEATWGKAVERLTARQIGDNPLSDSILEHIGGPYEPDFVGKGGTFAENHMFDVTTVGHEAAHYGRWYGSEVYYIHYWRP